MNLLVIFFFISVSFIELTRCISPLPLHLQLSPLDRILLFGEGKVPIYELIRIAYSTHESNSMKCVNFLVFDEEFNLKLQKPNRLLFSEKTPIWLANSTDVGINYNRVPFDSLHDALKFYEDPNNMAGISVKNDSRGNLQFTGYLRDRFILKKVPNSVHDLWQKSFNKTRHRVIRNTENSKYADYHIIIDRSTSDDFRINSASKTLRTLPSRFQKRNIINKEKIYFRVLLFVDFGEYYESYQEARFYQLLIYLVCFWNAVNMKYHEFHGPVIKLHIAGIVIRNHDNKYDESHKWIDAQTENKEVAITKFVEFLRENDPMPQDWDIAISQSNIPINGLDKTSQSIGLAYIGTSCRIHSLSLGLIEDNFNFKGIQPATHEIGHILGATHDGTGFSRCNDDGYIMSPTDDNKHSRSESWSWCSRTEILTRLRNRFDKCWNGTPSVHVNDQIPELLPGHITSLEDQCHLRGYDFACEEEKTTCDTLGCWSKSTIPLVGDFLKTCENAGLPFEGTFCGEGMHCKHQVCVSRTPCNMTNFNDNV